MSLVADRSERKAEIYDLLQRILLDWALSILVLHDVVQEETDQILPFGLVDLHLTIGFLLVDIFLDERFNWPIKFTSIKVIRPRDMAYRQKLSKFAYLG